MLCCGSYREWGRQEKGKQEIQVNSEEVKKKRSDLSFRTDQIKAEVVHRHFASLNPYCVFFSCRLWLTSIPCWTKLTECTTNWWATGPNWRASCLKSMRRHQKSHRSVSQIDCAHAINWNNTMHGFYWYFLYSLDSSFQNIFLANVNLFDSSWPAVLVLQ